MQLRNPATRAAALAGMLCCCAAAHAAEATVTAFPGALGWAAQTPGGRGGQILRVTTLAGSGPGSLRAAIETAGPRIVVFEVGGVIDLDRKSIRITEPFLTLAGQTAPAPGITLIRGGLGVAAHDVVIRHLRVRPGEAGVAKSGGWEEDGISTQGAYNVVVDHCSLSWATDENLSASGKRFNGDSPEQWRRNTSHDITFSNNIIAEGLAEATHAKGEHSKGMLIHDNAGNIVIARNLFAGNAERSPLFKGGARGVIVNNLIYNPGQRAIHYNLLAAEWAQRPYQDGQLAVVGNVLRAGPSTPPDLAMIMLGGAGNLQLHAKDNIAVDRRGEALPLLGRYGVTPARYLQMAKPPLWPQGLTAIAAERVETDVLDDVGARPWERELHDWRIVADVVEGRGKIIDSEQQVGGYPRSESSRQAFVPEDWNLETMEPRAGWPARSAP